jgi:hypothetical protein
MQATTVNFDEAQLKSLMFYTETDSAVEAVYQAVQFYLKNVPFDNISQQPTVHQEKKLQLLREKLQAGEDSPLVADFNPEIFMTHLHWKYTQ